MQNLCVIVLDHVNRSHLNSFIIFFYQKRVKIIIFFAAIDIELISLSSKSFKEKNNLTFLASQKAFKKI